MSGGEQDEGNDLDERPHGNRPALRLRLGYIVSGFTGALAIVVLWGVSALWHSPASAERGPLVEPLDSGALFPPGLPFSEVVRVRDTLYLSGQIGIVPGTLELVPGGLESEARQTMENIRTVLEAHGSSMSDVVKCTVMLADIAEWPRFNEIYASYFADHRPARSAFGASGLALGARVEVECVAVQRSAGEQ